MDAVTRHPAVATVRQVVDRSTPRPLPVLKGRVALVTGAGSGIGRAIARALIGAEAAVCLVGRNSAPLRRVAAEASGASATVIPADLGHTNAAATIAEWVERDLGRLDILIHCAATIVPNRIADATAEDFEEQFAVNLRAPYLLTKAVLPMLARAKGDVVFVNSSVVRLPKANMGQYAATKGALLALADSLRVEVSDLGVRVLTIFPGCTATPMQQRLYESHGRAGEYEPERLLQPEDIASTVLHAITLPRTAEITDIHIRPMQRAR
jgi:NAD(P)-dependent dehydrogenase (short-subunit alcohol dehydrogenase family)